MFKIHDRVRLSDDWIRNLRETKPVYRDRPLEALRGLVVSHGETPCPVVLWDGEPGEHHISRWKLASA